jgi:hypothetical protein
MPRTRYIADSRSAEVTVIQDLRSAWNRKFLEAEERRLRDFVPWALKAAVSDYKIDRPIIDAFKRPELPMPDRALVERAEVCAHTNRAIPVA